MGRYTLGYEYKVEFIPSYLNFRHSFSFGKTEVIFVSDNEKLSVGQYDKYVEKLMKLLRKKNERYTLIGIIYVRCYIHTPMGGQFRHCMRKGDTYIVLFTRSRNLSDEAFNMMVKRLESRVEWETQDLNLK